MHTFTFHYTQSVGLQEHVELEVRAPGYIEALVVAERMVANANFWDLVEEDGKTVKLENPNLGQMLRDARRMFDVVRES